jgi:hypothetical protein
MKNLVKIQSVIRSYRARREKLSIKEDKINSLFSKN